MASQSSSSSLMSKNSGANMSKNTGGNMSSPTNPTPPGYKIPPKSSGGGSYRKPKPPMSSAENPTPVGYTITPEASTTINRGRTLKPVPVKQDRILPVDFGERQPLKNKNQSYVRPVEAGFASELQTTGYGTAFKNIFAFGKIGQGTYLKNIKTGFAEAGTTPLTSTAKGFLPEWSGTKSTDNILGYYNEGRPINIGTAIKEETARTELINTFKAKEVEASLQKQAQAEYTGRVAPLQEQYQNLINTGKMSYEQATKNFESQQKAIAESIGADYSKKFLEQYKPSPYQRNYGFAYETTGAGLYESTLTVGKGALFLAQPQTLAGTVAVTGARGAVTLGSVTQTQREWSGLSPVQKSLAVADIGISSGITLAGASRITPLYRNELIKTTIPTAMGEGVGLKSRDVSGAYKFEFVQDSGLILRSNVYEFGEFKTTGLITKEVPLNLNVVNIGSKGGKGISISPSYKPKGLVETGVAEGFVTTDTGKIVPYKFSYSGSSVVPIGLETPSQLKAYGISSKGFISSIEAKQQFLPLGKDLSFGIEGVKFGAMASKIPERSVGTGFIYKDFETFSKYGGRLTFIPSETPMAIPKREYLGGLFSSKRGQFQLIEFKSSQLQTQLKPSTSSFGVPDFVGAYRSSLRLEKGVGGLTIPIIKETKSFSQTSFVPSSVSSFNEQRLVLTTIESSRYKTSSIQSVSSLQDFKLFQPSLITPPFTTPTVTPRTFTPFSSGFAFPPLFPPVSISDSLSSRKIRSGKRRYKYTPSYEAIVFNIRGKQPRGFESGARVRPITKGFKFSFGSFLKRFKA